MRPLTTAEIFQAWETGLDQSLAGRALTLLQAANPELEPGVLAGLTVGQRDGLLLTLRGWTFGPRLSALASCPQCRQQVELEFDIGSIQAGGRETPAEAFDDRKGTDVHEYKLSELEGTAVSFRLPTAADMLALEDSTPGGQPALPGTADISGARLWLLQRCITALCVKDQAANLAAQDEATLAAVASAVSARMAELDPQADVELALACPSCAQQWLEPFDILSYFWSEIQRWAQQMLVSIHTLARAYGWSEAEILALSPRRRQVYLEMIALGGGVR